VAITARTGAPATAARRHQLFATVIARGVLPSDDGTPRLLAQAIAACDESIRTAGARAESHGASNPAHNNTRERTGEIVRADARIDAASLLTLVAMLSAASR